jgi:diguanylate cyclase
MIELLCTITGVIAGIAAVASLVHTNSGRAKFEAEPRNVDTEEIRGIADQLQDISYRVAANVSAHSEKVEHINVQLGDTTSEESEKIVSTIQEIMRANESMQGQLADAQKRIAQQSQMIELTSQQARTDALTGLSNRRALDEFLGNCLSNPAENELVGLLLMDIDHFKSFNDSFGHTTGDAVLASFARSINKICGQECYAARFGGEEFAVILTGNSRDELVLKAAEIRTYVSEQVIAYEDLQLKITASGGLSILLAEDTISTAYERADEGLYQSKKAGRNCGFWLSDVAWTPFPVSVDEPPSRAAAKAKAPHASPPLVDSKSPTPEPEVKKKAMSKGDAKKLNAMLAEASKPVTEVLDLNSFLGRLEAYLDQLRRAELPAAAIMVEATGLSNFPASEALESWETVAALVQLNLRGIDVACLFRPYTLCIFMPGCSPDAVLERAGKIQHCFQDARDGWNHAAVPEKLSISLAGVDNSEDVAQFVNRLENALEEAQDASPNEVVVHNGESSHFQII